MEHQTAEIKIPAHIGIIMDGNGRWAKKRGLPRNAGHKKGAKVFGDITKYCKKIGVKSLTVYAFSSENWKRPKEEIEGILNLLRDYLQDMLSQANGDGKIQFLGDTSVLDDDLQELIRKAEEASASNQDFTVNIALNYGGRGEIAMAAKKIAEEVLENPMKVEKIDEDCISRHLYTAEQANLDLLIRPGGEQRISNFLLWQIAYAELVFMEVLWPDFTTKNMDDAIRMYSERQRRFGGV